VNISGKVKGKHHKCVIRYLRDTNSVDMDDDMHKTKNIAKVDCKLSD
jgi:hypothetical protein